MNARHHTGKYAALLGNCLGRKQYLLRNGKYFSIFRFVSFISTLAFMVAAFLSGVFWWWLTGLLFVVFIVLVVLHENLIKQQKFNDACILAISQEQKAFDGQYGSFDGGAEFIDPSHIYSTDLDVFGPDSLFQVLNRTTTLAGKSCLAGWLTQPLNSKDEIVARQEASKVLAGLAEWRIRFRAHGLVAGEERKDTDQLFEWLNTKPLFRSGFFSYVIYIVPVVSTAMTVLLAFGFLSIQLFLLYLVLPLAITGFHTKNINRRHAMLSKKVELLQKYAIRFRMLEDEGFTSGYLSRLVKKLKSGEQPASYGIRKLGRITASLDTRLNILAGFILNIYLLWDIRQMIRLEQWQFMHKERVPCWFDVLSETEAIAGFGAFSYANPGFVFPEIVTDQFVIRAVDAGHPLIPASHRVYNDISVTHRGHFNIVTGANMAGKSTYLRVVGVNMILALAGAPVCARSFNCFPAPVFTSLRTSDSLISNKSYFYAELLRLKELIDRLDNGKALFVLLDEILKGTNSADKQAGSKALLTQLIGLKAAGFIATHDLELGNLEQLFPGEVVNFHFEADIEGDELKFDYKLKPGIARNMNATFLMKKMGITI
ncbi:MAG: hypothetical protein V1775_17640 [Bacteroidota bacterium]